MRKVVERKENEAEVDEEMTVQRPALRLPQITLLQETVPGRGDHHHPCFTLYLYLYTQYSSILESLVLKRLV